MHIIKLYLPNLIGETQCNIMKENKIFTGFNYFNVNYKNEINFYIKDTVESPKLSLMCENL